jgi:hypothetical protein
MPRRSGRPRTNLARQILDDMSEHDERFEATVPVRLGSSAWRMAYEAARLRLVLEKGSAFEIARSEPLIRKLRETKWARANDPSGRLFDREFLERFVEAHAPGFDWREDARQGEIEDRIRKQNDEQFAQEHAEDARYGMARATKFYTPDAPDGVLLCALAWEYRKQHKFIRRMWPSLRERTLKKIIKSLRPKKGEIIKEPLRHKFVRRGTVPLRYGPRLIIGVLNEFVNRLPEFPMDDEQRKRLRKTALLVKRASAARLGHSRPIT